MKKWALILNNNLHEIFESEEKPEFFDDKDDLVEFIEITQPKFSVGWIYDRINNVFIKPETIEVPNIEHIFELSEKEIKDYKMEIDMEYIKCLLEIQGGL